MKKGSEKVSIGVPLRVTMRFLPGDRQGPARMRFKF